MASATRRFRPRRHGHLVILCWGVAAVAWWLLGHSPAWLLVGFLLLSFVVLAFLMRPTLTGTVLRTGVPRVDLAKIPPARLVGTPRLVSLQVDDPSLLRPIEFPLLANGRMAHRSDDIAALTAALRTSAVNAALADEIDALERMTPTERTLNSQGLPPRRGTA